jgi:hypothetical protein
MVYQDSRQSSKFNFNMQSYFKTGQAVYSLVLISSESSFKFQIIPSRHEIQEIKFKRKARNSILI